jgi:hypothetical protein
MKVCGEKLKHDLLPAINKPSKKEKSYMLPLAATAAKR